MTTRRGFLGGILAACAAPAIVLSPNVLMKGKPLRIWTPPSPRLVIYSGVPGSVAATPLASIDLHDDWLDAARHSRKTVRGSGAVDMSGTASHFEIVQADGRWAIRGEVSDAWGNGDLKLDNTALSNGSIISLTGLTIGAA